MFVSNTIQTYDRATAIEGSIIERGGLRSEGKSGYGAFCILTALFFFLLLTRSAQAQVNGLGQLPIMGWTSWSEEILHGEGWATGAQIKAQSDALKSSGLQAVGYVYIKIDSGWQSGFDSNGRPLASSTLFPDGIAATIAYIHANGQKAGIYWIPGVEQPVWSSSDTILGTSYTVASITNTSTKGNAFASGSAPYYHAKIDFSKPGAQVYINSVVNLFASWGVDFIKLDGVSPGSDIDNLTIDNRPDVQAWSAAIAQSGRPIWLTVSWALDHSYLSTWQSYANARRIENDVECYCSTLTTWPDVALRFNDLVTWENNAGPAVGWNDLDSLEVGNGTYDGMSKVQRQSQMSLWAIANSPLTIGDDLTSLDSYGLSLLGNTNVIRVDQTGKPGTQINSGNNPVWASPELSNGTYNVALFNLNTSASTATVDWSSLGFSGSADVYDLWNKVDLGNFSSSYGISLASDASSLISVTPNRGGSSPIASGSNYYIVNKNSGSVLEDPGSSTANGTFIDQWTLNYGTNQQWKATKSGPYWIFTNVASGKVLDDPGSDLLANTRIDQWIANSGTNQNWSVVEVGSGAYELINEVSGLLADVSGNSTSNSAEIVLYPNNGGQINTGHSPSSISTWSNRTQAIRQTGNTHVPGLPNNEQLSSRLCNIFIVTEMAKLQVRIDAFNTFNRPLW